MRTRRSPRATRLPDANYRGRRWPELCIAVAGFDEGDTDTMHTIGIYSVATGERLALFDGHVDTVRQLVFSPDGSQVLFRLTLFTRAIA